MGTQPDCNGCRRFDTCEHPDKGLKRCELFLEARPQQVVVSRRDRLDDLFEEQAKLNRRVGFDPLEVVHDDGELDLQFSGVWLNRFIDAMIGELCELRECTYWKHWYKEAREGKHYMLHDPEHAKVEVVDLFFFWMSLAQAVGLDPAGVVRLYYAKLERNHDRQDDDCTTQEAKGYDL